MSIRENNKWVGSIADLFSILSPIIIAWAWWSITTEIRLSRTESESSAKDIYATKVELQAVSVQVGELDAREQKDHADDHDSILHDEAVTEERKSLWTGKK